MLADRVAGRAGFTGRRPRDQAIGRPRRRTLKLAIGDATPAGAVFRDGFVQLGLTPCDRQTFKPGRWVV